MKKNLSIFPFKSNFFKEQDPFHLVIIFFIIFFGTAIFFSIPTFYDYKKYNLKIENTINKEFKINLHNLSDISFRFIPSPHLLIKKANLKIGENEEELVSEIENLKMFFSLVDFYKNDNFNIKFIKVKKANFYLNNLSLKNFIINLKKNIVKEFIIEKSTLFFKDEKEEIILISNIKNFNYKIDLINNKKILKMIGNIFDTDYDFKYLIDYKNPNTQIVDLEFKNPNIKIENKLSQISYTNKNQTGNLTIRFLNKKNSFNYKIEKSLINLNNENLKNSNFDLNGLIDFHPFHFDLSLDLKKINLLELEGLLYTIFKNQKMNFKNLSGSLNINFEDINHKVLNKGFITLKFENDNLFPEKKVFQLNNFATLEIVDYEYIENIEQLLQMKIKVQILNKEKFNRFLFNYKKNRIISDNIYFTYKYDSSTNTSFISSISKNGFGNSIEFYKFRNLTQLKNILKDNNIFNLD